jgi:ribosomal protein S18 acetylase RimI-like enzyme
MPAAPVIRQANEADLPVIADIITAAYSLYLGRMDRPPAPMLRDCAPDVEQGEVWVAGTPVTGLISLIPAGDSLLIENLAVHPAAQGTGLGRALMDFAEHQARELRLPRLTLYTHEVMTENQAIYAHLGYRETARRTENGYRRVFMQKELPPHPPSGKS